MFGESGEADSGFAEAVECDVAGVGAAADAGDFPDVAVTAGGGEGFEILGPNECGSCS